VTDKVLHQFYLRARELLGPLNDWRISLSTNDEAQIKESASRVASVLRLWEKDLAVYEEFSRKYEDFSLAHAVWYHGGEHGSEPVEPEWPHFVSRESYDKTERCLRRLRSLTKLVENEPNRYLASELSTELNGLVDFLDDTKRFLRSETSGNGEDGPIDRNQLAKLLCIAQKTLKNRAAELPEPIQRGHKDVPVFRYSEAKAALSLMFPDRAFMLVAYKEAIAKSH
jgi:hypothetical protein